MATYWEISCSFGLRNVFLVSVPDGWFFFPHFGFWSGNLFLIAPFPDLCLLVPFCLCVHENLEGLSDTQICGNILAISSGI